MVDSDYFLGKVAIAITFWGEVANPTLITMLFNFKAMEPKGPKVVNLKIQFIQAIVAHFAA